MNQLPFFNANATMSMGFNQSFASNPFGNCCNSMLGASSMNPLQMMSSLMQSLMGGGNLGMSGYGNSMSQFGNFGGQPSIQDMFSQFQSGQYGQSNGYGSSSCSPPYYGSSYGSQGYGGYGCDPNFMSPYGGQSQCGSQSGCGNFQFGNQCPPNCCDRNASQGGQLQQEAEGKPISYTTSGGYQISINGSTINVTDPNGENTVKTWGDPHENVNGEHVKDWQDKQRTMILGDGTKITMSADNPKGVVEAMSIYDGNQSVQIQNDGIKITGHSYNPWQTRSQEANQYDGETSIFKTNYNGAATYSNIYSQDSDFNVTRAYEPIATTQGRYGTDPGKTTDLYPGR